jgi:hypothetical protein
MLTSLIWNGSIEGLGAGDLRDDAEGSPSKLGRFAFGGSEFRRVLWAESGNFSWEKSQHIKRVHIKRVFLMRKPLSRGLQFGFEGSD